MKTLVSHGLGILLAVSLVSATPSSVTLYLVGDLYMKDYVENVKQVVAYLAELKRDHPDARIILAGDICNDTPYPECYEALEELGFDNIAREAYSVPGNHDYELVKNSAAVPIFYNYLFNYGERGKGWQAFNYGAWRVYGLNSEVMGKMADDQINPLGAEQLKWFEKDLHEHYNDGCLLTVWHRPMFSSGGFASPTWTRGLYTLSYKYGVDLSVTAHEHFFDHLPKLAIQKGSDEGVLDRDYGIEGLIVGTGGARPFPRPRNLKYGAGGEEMVTNTPGVLELKLSSGSYEWRFLPVPKFENQRTTYPSGQGICHDNPTN